eukprot:Rhum_TRINITY_DN1030_c0_g1::Rhum_TRINITY_DN1030_c0_g1_i1::g.3158::m.3158
MASTPANPSSEYPYNTGEYRRDGCGSEWEAHGLLWQYGYNHEEAIRCYKAALEEDPNNLFAAFGVAYCVGPNYNKPYEAFGGQEKRQCIEIAHDALAKAEEVLQASGGDGGLDGQLVRALRKRYPTRAVADGDLEECNAACSEALRTVHEAHPDNLEVATLYCEATMLLRPWALWCPRTGEPTFPGTLAVRSTLEASIKKAEARGIAHPGLLHLYIHLMELSREPQAALAASKALEPLCPDVGHLIHMPSHIYIQVGMYAEATEANRAAVVADHKYLSDPTLGRGMRNFYSLYRFHDLHFMAWAAMFKGHLGDALHAANEIIRTVPTEDLTSPWFDHVVGIERTPLADWFEGFIPTYLHALVRFGRWRDVVAEDEARWDAVDASGTRVYTSTLATLHYAKGVAHATLSAKGGELGKEGHLREARRHCEAFDAAVAYLEEKTPERRVMMNKVSQILGVAREILYGETLFREGRVDEGLERLRQAVLLDDGGTDCEVGLVYDEPWGWMMPARHAYGALSLEAGRHAEAEKAYKEDLGDLPATRKYPDNIYSLVGLSQVLRAQGADEGAEHKAKVAKARALTDTDIFASCLCKCGN